MEKRILKLSVRVLIPLIAIVISFLYFYPRLYQQYLIAKEDEQAQQIAQLEEKRAKIKAAEEVVEESEELDGQLKMELPEGIEAKKIKIKNDYLTQVLTISFPSDCVDYFTKYRLKGSSANISSISYYNTKGRGVLEFQLNALYEVESELRDGNMFFSFTDPHDIYDKVIVVDAGHGQNSIGGATMQGVEEKDLNLAIVTYLKEYIEASDKNIGVYFTRLDNSDPSLMDRAKMANAAHADLFISVHNNALKSGHWSSANGTSVLYSESDESGQSKKFAKICLDNVGKAFGSNRRGVVEGDNIYIVRTSEVPVALIEVGFMTNRTDFNKLIKEEYQRKAAEGIYNAILEAFESGF